MASLPSTSPAPATVTPESCTASVLCSDNLVSRRLMAALAAHNVSALIDERSVDELAEHPEGDDLLVMPWAQASIGPLRDLAAARHIVAVVPAGAGALVRKLLRAGVAGIVLDPEVEQTLAVTVLAVAAGQVVIPVQSRQQAERPALSTREKQILAMVVMGLTNSEIAARLFLTESTIKTHLSSAFGKLGVRSRYEAAALIMDPEQALGPGILHISDDVSPGPANPGAATTSGWR